MSPVLIRGVRLYGAGDPVDVLVDDRQIAEIGAGLTAPADAEVIEATGQILLPGLVDLHTHLREPGREDTETIETGSAAAALGGFTAVFTSGSSCATRMSFQCPSYSLRYRKPRYGLNSRYSVQEYGMPSTSMVRRWNPMTWQGCPSHVPRVPSGMVGVKRSRLRASWSTKTFGSLGSSRAPQDVQATDSVCVSARSSTAAPQLARQQLEAGFDQRALGDAGYRVWRL